MRRIVLSALLASGLAGAQGSAVAAPVCEPAKLAEKYPSLKDKVLKIGVDPQTAPYAMRDKDDFDKMVGLDVALSTAVLDCAGIKHEFFLGGWSGLLPATTSGQIDIFWDNLYYKPERAEKLDFVVYMQAATGALVAAGNPKGVKDLASSCGTSYAVGLGTTQEADAKKADADCQAAGKPPVTVFTYPDHAAGLRLLQTGRADVILVDLAMADSLAAENPQTYARAYLMLTGITIGAGVKNDSPDLLRAIYDGLQVVQADGKQAEIMKKYNVDPAIMVPAEIKTK